MSNPDHPIAPNLKLEYPNPDPSVKTILLIADNKGTEIFDLLAPYHILTSVTNANVFIVSKEAEQVPLHRGLSILPHHTFQSFEQFNITPDAMVIPNLSTIAPDEMDPDIINFITRAYHQDVHVLSVCDGAATAAHTGLFDDRPMIAHASDLPMLKNYYPNIVWTVDKKVVLSERLISTAGVSNATEGTFLLLDRLYGPATVEKAMKLLNYPSDQIMIGHQSKPIRFRDKLAIFSKVTFKKNQEIGILLEDGISEFTLAALLDTYSRTFPKSIATFTLDDFPLKSLNGLTLIPTTRSRNFDLAMCLNCEEKSQDGHKQTKLRSIDLDNNTYVFDELLDNHIGKDYSDTFTKVVAKLLDYNME